MQKKLIISMLLCLLMGFQTYCFAAEDQNLPGTRLDEALFTSMMQRTYAPKMIFEGGNESWTCSYRVVDTVLPVNETESTAKNEIALWRDCTYDPYTRRFEYSIKYSRGWFSGAQWLKNRKAIKLESNADTPNRNEYIPVQITEWSKQEIFYLNNVIDSTTISPVEAFRKAFDVYRATYRAYPTNEFSFKIDFYDKTYWLVTFNDNDGIGGDKVLLINAYTGEAGDIKEDE